MSGKDQTIVQEQVISVSRMYRKQAAGSATQVEIQKFITEPAKVSVRLSKTIQLEQYEPLTIQVGVELPCYKEELTEATVTAYDYAKQVLLNQLATVDQFRAQIASALRR